MKDLRSGGVNRDRTILVRYDRLGDLRTDRSLATSYELVAITRMSISRACTWTAAPLPARSSATSILASPTERRAGSSRGGEAQDPLLEANAASHRAVVVAYRVAPQIGRGDGPDARTGRRVAAHQAPDDRFGPVRRRGCGGRGRARGQDRRSEFCPARLVPFVALSRWLRAGVTRLSRVLLIEDDPRVVRFVRRGLAAEGFAVDVAENGEDGLELCRSNDYDLVVLDRMLPGMDGMDVCDSLRRERRDCLILMLTAMDSLPNKIEGLQAGADDYLTKPFAFEELLARMRALLRRARYHHVDPVLQVGDLVLDHATRKARRGDRKITLTVKEYMLLAYLMRNAGKVVSRTQILNQVWGYGFDPGTKVVDVYIRYLRQKVDADADVPLIRTERGFGYMIAAE